MHQITVTIGRRDNVNGLELSNEEWAKFKSQVSIVIPERFEIVVASEGNGSWTDSEGEQHPEANFVVVGVCEATVGFVSNAAAELAKLRRDLADLALSFDQDAIALGIGTSELIEATDRPEPWGCGPSCAVCIAEEAAGLD